jgi:hypothetical protein
MTDHYPFPVAPHSYFRARNKDQARAAFLQSDASQPQFIYHDQFNPDTIRDRQQSVAPDSEVWRLLQFVEKAAVLQHDRTSLAAYRTANEQLFGAPQKEYALAILGSVSRCVTDASAIYWREVQQMIGATEQTHTLIGPSGETFKTYKSYFERYASISNYASRDVIGALQLQLEATGLSNQGWKVRVLSDNTSHARTHQRVKTISIGEQYRPRTKKAAMRIAVHEVYGHALRGNRTSTEESEGFAIVLEQLLADTFRYRRSYRYLAVSLGWGVLGTPMTFREVFEILWRVMAIGSAYDIDDAKSHAFDECYRAFRGGRPDVAGAVYLKDSIYFRANTAMWRILETADIGYGNFVDIIEGRKELLS